MEYWKNAILMYLVSLLYLLNPLFRHSNFLRKIWCLFIQIFSCFLHWTDLN